MQLVKIARRCVTSEFQSITIHALDLIDVSVWKRSCAATLILLSIEAADTRRRTHIVSLRSLCELVKQKHWDWVSEWVWEQLPTVFMTRASLWVIFNHLELIRAGESRTNNSYTLALCNDKSSLERITRVVPHKYFTVKRLKESLTTCFNKNIKKKIWKSFGQKIKKN